MQGELFTPIPLVDPVKEPAAPFQRGSHDSWTGAQSQSLPIWTEKQADLLAMLDNGHPLTRNQLALFLHWPLSSVCSVLASVRDRLEVVDYETVEWAVGGKTKTTKRERFRIRR